MIADVAQADEQAAGEALERLVRRYWAAVYAYVRGTGRDVHAAADLTQGFVCDVIISRRLCDAADPARGRFRTLLLTALRNYIRERHRHEARRRPLKGAGGSRDPEETVTASHARSEPTPEEAFSYQWSATLVRRVVSSVRASCEAAGLDAHWAVFEQRVVRPMLMGDAPVDYATLVRRLNLRDESQAANMMITVKRRFARALHDEVGETVFGPREADEEICELLRDLERPK